MDYLQKYGVKSVQKFQEGGAAAPPPAGADPAIQQAAELIMQVIDAAMQGDQQAGQILVQIAQAISGGAEGGAPPAAANGPAVYRQGGKIGGPTFGKRTTLVPHQS